jgi:type I restriction enzyme M protein
MAPDSVTKVEAILRHSSHALTIFPNDAASKLVLMTRRGKPYVECYVTGKERPATPEEIVRQLYLHVLVDEYRYAKSRISIEKPVQFGSAVHEKAADIVISAEDEPDSDYIIVEVKKPKRPDGVEQLKSYCNATGSPIGVWTNGGQVVVLHRQDPNIYRELTDIPKSGQKLSNLLDEKWTIKDLEEVNKLAKEETTLKEVILDMENLVLANAGVDAFEEVFKLIYAKLYDEWYASHGGAKKRYLQFRVAGATPKEFYDKISALFDDAKKKWPGVFLSDEQIDLTPAHLVTCGSFLQDIKLFNSNLQVIDEAFEYLSVQVGKGQKGQYFTPRHVIDMCVRMMNPNIDEFVIDTAAGSCGFTVHSIFHVWGNQFLAKGPEQWQAEYAREKVYALDFDPRSIKIAKALNLIAGDGRTNVFRANTLDPRTWSEEVRLGLRPRLLRFKDPAQDKWNQENFRYFSFDALMTNPPFAGDIKDARILHQFDLAKKDNGKWNAKAGRDILFIERNLEFLRPGGRMAIVLPQGRLNNSSDERVRNFIANRARILAVVSLDINTFKPHTGTKTSVLFLQKWNEDKKAGPLCKKQDDYPIFMAVSQKSGKDSSGEYVFKREGRKPVLDSHSHPILEHDLDDIADEFATWAKKQKLSFAME